MHLIFDLDGTLIDSRAGIEKSLLFSLSKSFKTDMSLSSLQIGPPINDMIKQLLPDLSSKKNQEILKIFRAHYDSEGWSLYTAYPEAKNILKILKEKHTLFIATNKPKIPTERILKHMGVFDLFDKILCYGEERFENKASMVRYVQKLYGEDVCLMIGDSNDDYLAARSNSIDFIQCSYGYGSIESLETTGATEIKKLKDLLSVIKN